MLSALLCGFILFSKCGLVASLFMSIVGPFFCIDLLRVRIQVILLSVCCEVSDSICMLPCLVTEARDCQRNTCAFTTKLVIQDFWREKDSAASIVTVHVCTQGMGLGFAFIFRLLTATDCLWESSRVHGVHVISAGLKIACKESHFCVKECTPVNCRLVRLCVRAACDCE